MTGKIKKPAMKRASKGRRHNETVPENHPSSLKLGELYRKCQGPSIPMDRAQYMGKVLEKITTTGGSTEAEEDGSDNEKGSCQAATAPVGEALPLAPKRRRAAQDGRHTVKSLKEALRQNNASTTGNKDALMDRLAKVKVSQKERGSPGAAEETVASEVVPNNALDKAKTSEAALQEIAEKMIEPGLSAEDLATRVEGHYGFTFDDAEKDKLIKITKKIVYRAARVRRSQGNQYARKTREMLFKRYSWSEGSQLPTSHSDRIEIARQIKLLRANIFRLRHNDPRLKEGKDRVAIMSEKLEQNRTELQTCKEVDTIEDQVGRAAADAERFQAKLSALVNGIKRHTEKSDSVITDYQVVSSRWDQTGTKTVGLAAR